MICKYCGKKYDEDNIKFCSNCGSKLEQTIENEEINEKDKIDNIYSEETQTSKKNIIVLTAVIGLAIVIIGTTIRRISRIISSKISIN